MFAGANKNAEMVALDPAKLRVNYFKGNDKAKWYSNIPTSLAVLYKSLYKNIDLKVYGIERQIEYDWIVKPGANPADIKVEYKNVKSTRIDKDGNVVIETKFGELIHQKPVAFQKRKAQSTLFHPAPSGHPSAATQNLASQYDHVDVAFKKIGKNTYGFTVGNYNKTRELIIDPIVLAYSTYLGGSGNNDIGHAIAVDNSNYVYVTGETDSTDFPTLDEYMGDPSDSNSDVFITKIDTNQPGVGSLIYSTYLGGDDDDVAWGIAVSGVNHAYITGHTDSTDFPLLGEYQGDQTGTDAFVAQVDTGQPGQAGLIYSTYLGGSGSAERGEGIAFAAGMIFVTGYTDSTDFPTVEPYQTDQPGIDAFVSKLDPTLGGAGLLYSTYLGGSGDDVGSGIAADGTINAYAYITGSTDSTDFPISPFTAPYQPASGGGSDAFVARVWTAPGANGGPFTLYYFTYLGGSGDDFGFGIALDEGLFDIFNTYVTGTTDSTNFPTMNSYQGHQGGDDAFLTKINPYVGGAPGLLYSTYLGGSGNDSGLGVAYEFPGTAFITGGTASTNFPTLDEYQADQTGEDAYVTKIDTILPGVAGLIYSTYLGGGGQDRSNGIAVRGGVAYVGGFTASSDFPTVDEYQSALAGGTYDAFVAKLTTSGSITVISPNGGEVWGPGTTQNIEWDAPGVGGAVGIGLYKDGSPVGVIVDAVEPDASPYVWTVGEYIGGTADPGSGYTVKVKDIGSSVSDTSDAPFTISELTLTAPNGFESWAAGSTKNITWNAPGMSGNMQITLWQSAALVGVIADGIDPAAGSYAWTVGNYIGGTAVPGAGFTIKIEETGSAISDESDDPFIISALGSIIVTSPNGGESWDPGTIQNITWTSTGVTTPLVIGLFKDGAGVGVIVDEYDPALGSYAWTVGEYIGGTAASGTGYTVKIKEKSSLVSDVSDAPFEILPGTLALASPNGGESWASGTLQNITWSAPGFSGTLYIGILKGGALLGVIAKNIDVTAGSYSWTVGQYIGGTAPVDSDYTIGIKLKGTGTKDISDAAFDITAGPPPITVLSPNGGEDWEIGPDQAITWTAPGATGLLRIFLLKDGVTLGTIANNVDPTSGSIPWRTGVHSNGTAAAGTGYKVKIKQKLVLVSDISDASFSLTNSPPSTDSSDETKGAGKE
jgi:hypothetical protein